MFLERMKTTDFDPKERYIFVVPMGATEQHGPFLPLGTDSYIQDTIIEVVDKELPHVIFLPTLRVTCSKEHEGFLGSVWIQPQTMEAVLKDICLSVQEYAKSIIFVSWHGGNIGMLNRFIEKYQASFDGVRLKHVLLDQEEAMEKTRKLLNGPVDEHAGNSEISMMLACDKDLVALPPQDYPKHQIENAWDSDRLADVSKDGIVDNHPKWVVNEENGKQCIEMAAQELQAGIKRILDADSG